ncbi:hypothetical protein Tco_0433122 [Tanacetum coccineum]
MTDNSQKAQCKHCFHFLSVSSNTTLRDHIAHPHCEAKKAQQNQNSEAGQTSMARDGSVFRYDPDYLREQFAGLVIQRALPFNHFDNEQTTRVFQNTMQPRYTHVSRSTLKRDAMKLWLAAKQEIIDSFGNINACVNLTTDVWSAPHGVPGSYMCVTAHWIEPGTWQMMKRSSGSVLSIRRTRLTPASLEMCMCLKDHLDAKERKQDKCPLETPLDFEEGVFDDETMASTLNRRGKAKTLQPWTTTEKITLCTALCKAMENYDTGDMKKSVQQMDENGSSDLVLFQNALAEFETGYGHPFTMETCWRILKNHEAWTEVEMPSFNQRPMDKKTTQSNPPTPEKPLMPPISSFPTIEKSADEHEICDGYLNEKEQQQLLLDEEALRETLEEEARAEKELEERIKMLEEEAKKEQAHDELFRLEFGVKSDSEYESE